MSYFFNVNSCSAVLILGKGSCLKPRKLLTTGVHVYISIQLTVFWSSTKYPLPINKADAIALKMLLVKFVMISA